MNAAELIDAHRPVLFSVAYEILGSVADAEDVLQESFLRLRDVDMETVDSPRTYALRVVSRQALNTLRAARRRRELYVGTWLPEPLEMPTASGPAEHVLNGEVVTTAMLLILETLSPMERVVFVLREVFEFSYAEVGRAVGRGESTVRQTALRARRHVRAGTTRALVDPLEARNAARQLLAAATTGDVGALLFLLDPDVVYRGDGGGRRPAARRPIVGAERVAQVLAAIWSRAPDYGDVSCRFGVFNELPAVVVSRDGTIDLVMEVEVTRTGVTALYVIRNPDKLAHLSHLCAK